MSLPQIPQALTLIKTSELPISGIDLSTTSKEEAPTSSSAFICKFSSIFNKKGGIVFCLPVGAIVFRLGLPNPSARNFKQMPENLQSHAKACFRFSLGAVLKGNRGLKHFDPAPIDPPQNLLQVRVPLGLNLADADRPQGVGAVDTKGTAVVMGWQTEEQSGNRVDQSRTGVTQNWPP